MLGVTRVAMVSIRGPVELAPTVGQSLLEVLNETARYQVVTPDQLQLAAPGPLLHPNGAVDRRVSFEAARRLGADALLLASVEIAEEGWSDVGNVRMIIGDPTVRAVCQVQLIDVRSGRTLFDGSDEQTYRGEFSSTRTSPTSRPRVYERLARDCTVAVARRITPHQFNADVALSQDLFGKGSGSLRRGNSLAREGRWDEAHQQWLTALSENPQNDAATYSVGLAHEARGEFSQAEQRYQEAIAMADRPLYREALERVQQASHEHRLAWSQLTATRPLPNVAFDGQVPYEHPAGYEIPATRPVAEPEPRGGLSPIDAPSVYESRLPYPLGNTTAVPFYR